MYFIVTYVFSFGLGLLLKDRLLLGSLSMYIAFLQTYFMAFGKWYEEFFGMLGTVVSAVICALSGMYATAIFTLILYVPLSIFTMINWKKHVKNSEVELSDMTKKQSVICIALVAAATAAISFLLSLIPTQNLAVLDAAGDILNIAGIILIALRYKEGWLVWLLGSGVDLVTWVAVFENGYSQNAVMMIIMSGIYLLLNLWGFFSFIRLKRRQNGEAVLELGRKKPQPRANEQICQFF